MADKFSLKDHLFNAETVGQLAAEYAAALPGFDREAFVADCVDGFASRELMDRMDWIADQVERRLAPDFATMADQIRAAMPPELDPDKTDEDFGHFIHAIPGILAVRHGMDDVDRALDLLHAATKRFSMEFYIRPFLNAHPDQTLDRLRQWVTDPNYHVRRLVSEGTRARLPWAKRIALDPKVPLEFLDDLFADSTRYVTRSVANHLNDVAKIDPDAALYRLGKWRASGQQTVKEMTWIERHALRSLIKDGHPDTMAFLGYRSDLDVSLTKMVLDPPEPQIGGQTQISFSLTCATDEPVVVDYILHQTKSNGDTAPKVFKLKDTALRADAPMAFKKVHKFKANATTFTLRPGQQRVDIQVNGRVIGGLDFNLTAP